MNCPKMFSCIPFLLLASLSAIAGDGQLDAGFAGNGKAIVSFSASGNPVDASANAIVIQPDGKIVLAGLVDHNSLSSAFSRLDPDGALDTTFGDGGRVGGLFVKEAGADDSAQAIALQPDGKIVAFGFLSTSGYVVRLTASGQKDASFGDAGVVIYPSSGLGTAKFDTGAITSTGHILASGSYDDGTGAGPTLLNVLFDANGTVVAAQNISSVLALDKAALVMQPDGKAVIAVTNEVGCAVVRDDVGAALNLDSNFGNGGIVNFSWGLSAYDIDYCFAIALQRDARILIGGLARSGTDLSGRATVLRLSTNGTLDPSFGKKNFAFASAATGMASSTQAILVQNDQRIVLTGIADTPDPAHAPDDFAALRLLSDGTLDATFTATTAGSSLGKVVFGFETGSGGRDDGALAAAVQGDRIVMAGFRETSNSAKTRQFAIARLQNDGIFADGFGP